MPAAPLEVENLTAGYGPTRVLEGVSFSRAGRRAAGRARPQRHGQDDAAGDACRPDRRRYDGTIRIGGDGRHRACDSARARASGLGYVPQARCVFPSLTVEENLFVGLKGRPNERPWRKPMRCSRA